MLPDYVIKGFWSRQRKFHFIEIGEKSLKRQKTFVCHQVVCSIIYAYFYYPDDWRLFIETKNFQYLMAMTMKLLLDLIDYKSYNWKLCCDLKVVAILTSLQGSAHGHGLLKDEISKHSKEQIKAGIFVSLS